MEKKGAVNFMTNQKKLSELKNREKRFLKERNQKNGILLNSFNEANITLSKPDKVITRKITE